MFEPETGKWYIVVSCEKCTSTIFLFPDLNEGKSVLDANYIVTCPRCAHKGGYRADHYYHSAEQQQASAPSHQATAG